MDKFNIKVSESGASSELDTGVNLSVRSASLCQLVQGIQEDKNGTPKVVTHQPRSKYSP